MPSRPVLTLAGFLLGGLLLVGCSGGGMQEEDSGSAGPTFSSRQLAPGESFSTTFQEEGAEYYCTIHGSDMEGTVVVDADAEKSGTATVSMENTTFSPQRITVQPGTEVVWTNNDDVAHTVKNGNPSTTDGGRY